MARNAQLGGRHQGELDDMNRELWNLVVDDNSEGVLKQAVKREILHKTLDEHGNTLLHWAAHAGSLSVVKMLVDVAPGILNAKAKRGWSPLTEAQYWAKQYAQRNQDEWASNCLKVVMFLQDKGALQIGEPETWTSKQRRLQVDTNWQSSDGQELIARDVNPESCMYVDADLKRRLSGAARHDNHNQLVALLQTNPSLLQIKNGNGDSLLHIAAEHACSQACKVLLSMRADANALNDRGWSPLTAAMYWEKSWAAKGTALDQQTFKQVITLLRQHGAQMIGRAETASSLRRERAARGQITSHEPDFAGGTSVITDVAPEDSVSNVPCDPWAGQVLPVNRSADMKNLWSNFRPQSRLGNRWQAPVSPTSKSKFKQSSSQQTRARPQDHPAALDRVDEGDAGLVADACDFEDLRSHSLSMGIASPGFHPYKVEGAVCSEGVSPGSSGQEPLPSQSELQRPHCSLSCGIDGVPALSAVNTNEKTTSTVSAPASLTTRQCLMQDSILLRENGTAVSAAELRKGMRLAGLRSTAQHLEFSVAEVRSVRVESIRDQDVADMKFEGELGSYKLRTTTGHGVLCQSTSEGLPAFQPVEAGSIKPNNHIPFVHSKINMLSNTESISLTGVSKHMVPCKVVEIKLQTPMDAVLVQLKLDSSGEGSKDKHDVYTAVFGSPESSIDFVVKNTFIDANVATANDAMSSTSDPTQNRKPSVRTFRKVARPHDAHCTAWCKFHFSQQGCKQSFLCQYCHDEEHAADDKRRKTHRGKRR